MFTSSVWISTDATLNEIRANTITLRGAVNVANGGTLGLVANSGVNIYGAMNMGLGADSFGNLDMGAFSLFWHFHAAWFNVV